MTDFTERLNIESAKQLKQDGLTKIENGSDGSASNDDKSVKKAKKK